jgi:hypothetical protein
VRRYGTPCLVSDLICDQVLKKYSVGLHMVVDSSIYDDAREKVWRLLHRSAVESVYP